MTPQPRPLPTVALMICTFFASDVVHEWRRRQDEQRIELRDEKGRLRMVLGEVESGTWGMRVFDEQARPRIGAMLFDATDEVRMTLADATVSRGINLSVDPNLGTCEVQVGHSLSPADTAPGARDAIVLECTDTGSTVMGIFSGRGKPRIGMGVNPEGPTVGVHVFDDDLRPRASLLRKADRYGWAILDENGKSVARARYSKEDGLSIEPNK